jgi:hypothetical protein
MTQTVLPQLQEISDDLLAQEEDLIAQLAEVQEKLKGVRAILPLFGDIPGGISLGEEDSDEDLDEDFEEDFDEEPPTRSVKTRTAKSSKAASGKLAPSTKAKLGKAAASKPSAGRTSAKAEKKPKADSAKTASSKAAAKKKDGRAASWQKYTRPGVKEKSIPEAVRLVLETQPEKSFKIAEVMDALFNETMPKSQHLKARNRISNVLSGGVRSGEWFKGDRGTYRLSTD